MTWVLAVLLSLYPAVVKDYGVCGDVMSPSCPVRAYWPRETREEAVGMMAYWLRSTENRVCFVTRQMYGEAIIGQRFDCLWRDQQP